MDKPTYNISRNGSRSLPIETTDITPNLAKGYYKLIEPPNQPIQLEDYNPFVLPEKIYGGDKLDEFTSRVLNTFSNIKGNLGVLLSGLKGTGKSVQLKHIAVNSQMPCIIIDVAFHGSQLISFLEKIPTSCVVIFDEFEKVYRKREDQATILPLLDGLSTGHHMFLFTVNGGVCEFLLNRPSRVRYLKNYSSLDEATIREIVGDLLNGSDEKKAELVTFLTLFPEMNVDTVITIINEFNMYPDDSISEVAEIFNIENPMDIDMNIVAELPVLVVSDTKADSTVRFENEELAESILKDHNLNGGLHHFNIANCIGCLKMRKAYGEAIEAINVACRGFYTVKTLGLRMDSSINELVDILLDTGYLSVSKDYTVGDIGFGDKIANYYGGFDVNNPNNANEIEVSFKRNENSKDFVINVNGVVVAKAKPQTYHGYANMGIQAL